MFLKPKIPKVFVCFALDNYDSTSRQVSKQISPPGPPGPPVVHCSSLVGDLDMRGIEIAKAHLEMLKRGKQITIILLI